MFSNNATKGCLCTNAMISSKCYSTPVTGRIRISRKTVEIYWPQKHISCTIAHKRTKNDERYNILLIFIIIRYLHSNKKEEKNYNYKMEDVNSLNGNEG